MSIESPPWGTPLMLEERWMDGYRVGMGPTPNSTLMSERTSHSIIPLAPSSVPSSVYEREGREERGTPTEQREGSNSKFLFMSEARLKYLLDILFSPRLMIVYAHKCFSFCDGFELTAQYRTEQPN